MVEAIAALPPQCKRTVDLSLTNKSTKEIAEVPDIGVNTMKVLKSRAIRKLREYFLENDIWIEF